MFLKMSATLLQTVNYTMNLDINKHYIWKMSISTISVELWKVAYQLNILGYLSRDPTFKNMNGLL